MVRCLTIAAILAPTIAVAQQRQPSAAHTEAVSGHRRPVAIREQTADQQVMQVLNRLAFGPRPGDALRVRDMGVDAWIEQQLHPEHVADDAMDELLARYPLLQQDQSALAAQYTEAQRQFRLAKRDTAVGATAGAAPNSDTDAIKAARRSHAQLLSELESERVARAVSSNRQLLEVMTDFWENHFNVFAGKNAVEPYYLAGYDQAIRDHALGKFRDLLGSVAHSPAMLVYLDNAQSRANPDEPTLNSGRRDGMTLALGARSAGGAARAGGTPLLDAIILRRNLNAQQAQQLRQRAAAAKKSGLNENYGRELLELHTLGVDGGYTQQDVIAAARALTGWTVRPPAQGGGFIFRPEWHDAASKVFLGHTLAAGRGEQDGEDVLDIISRSPATAHFLARQLARRFVSDSPSTALVEAAAQTYLRTDGDIREVVRTIVTSPEFFSARAYHSKVKSPFEVVVSAARALGAAPDTTARTALAVAYLGQPVFGHRDPNGWPETGESWMNTGAILNRINFGLAVAANRLPGATINMWPGADSLRTAPRAEQVDAVVSRILGGAVSPDMRKILMTGDHPLMVPATVQAAQATQAASQPAMQLPARAVTPLAIQAGAQAVPPKKARRNGGGQLVGAIPQLSGLPQVIGLALGSPEFQRR